MNDVRYAFRTLWKSPGFSLVALLTLALGLPLAIWATRVLSTMLDGVKPGDPATLAAISVLLVAVSVGASYLPAR